MYTVQGPVNTHTPPTNTSVYLGLYSSQSSVCIRVGRFHTFFDFFCICRLFAVLLGKTWREKKLTLFQKSKWGTPLKGQCHKFLTLFCLTDSTLAPDEQAKTVLQTFSFLRRYSQKTCGGVIVDFSDTSWNIRWLRGHGFSVVNDYADTVSE